MVLYFSIEKLYYDLRSGRIDNTHWRQLLQIGKKDLLILDNLGLQKTKNLIIWILCTFEDRHSQKHTIICSQLPVNACYDNIDESIIADAIRERILGSAHLVEPQRKSLRNPQ
jgi:DNA replication protein DnaC